MLFGGKVSLSLKTRTLHISIAAAAAAVLLTYRFAYSDIKALALEESGSRLFTQFTEAAAKTGAAVKTDIESARRLAASPEVRALLRRPGHADPRAAGKTLASAAGKIPGIAAAVLTRSDGKLLAVYAGEHMERTLDDPPEGELAEDEARVSPPSPRKGSVSYWVDVPAGPGEDGPGLLRCRFKGRRLPAVRTSSGKQAETTLVKREGSMLKGVLPGGRTELPLASPDAAMFSYAVQGKEGASDVRLDGATHVFAHTYIKEAGWIACASHPYLPEEVASAAAAVKKLRVQAALVFACISMALFIGIKAMSCPVSESARLAQALLGEFGIKTPPSEGGCEDTLIINSALSGAYDLLRRKEESGLELEKEAEKLREEDEDLKYQNLQLDKINQYLLEREARIAELKKELRELQQKVELAKKP